MAADKLTPEEEAISLFERILDRNYRNFDQLLASNYRPRFSRSLSWPNRSEAESETAEDVEERLVRLGDE